MYMFTGTFLTLSAPVCMVLCVNALIWHAIMLYAHSTSTHYIRMYVYVCILYMLAYNSVHPISTAPSTLLFHPFSLSSSPLSSLWPSHPLRPPPFILCVLMYILYKFIYTLYICIYIYPVTMVSVGYHCGLSVIYPQFELAVRHLEINHYILLTVTNEQSLQLFTYFT